MALIANKNRTETQPIPKANRLIELPEMVSKAFYVFSGILGLVLGFNMFFNVIGRYFFNQPIRGAAEISVYIVYITAFLTAPWLLKVDKHITVDFLSESALLKNKWFSLIKDIVCLMVVALIFVRSIAVTYDQFIQGVIILDTLETPRYLLSLVIPVSFFLLSIIYLEKIWKKIKGLDQV